jgi:hypothetical protein
VDVNASLRQAIVTLLGRDAADCAHFPSLEGAIAYLAQHSPSAPLPLLLLVEARIYSNAPPTVLSALNAYSPRTVLMGTLSALRVQTLPFLRKPVRRKPLRQLLQAFGFLQCKESSTKTRSVAPSTPTMPPSTLSILVVEDNHMNQVIIGKLLQSLGYTNLAVAENGRQAIDALKRNKFDVVLMDLMVRRVFSLALSLRFRSL